MKTNFNNLYTFKKLDVKIEVRSLQPLEGGERRGSGLDEKWEEWFTLRRRQDLLHFFLLFFFPSEHHKAWWFLSSGLMVRKHTKRPVGLFCQKRPNYINKLSKIKFIFFFAIYTSCAICFVNFYINKYFLCNVLNHNDVPRSALINLCKIISI